MEKIKEKFSNDVDTMSNIILAIETNNVVAFEYHKDVGFTDIRKVLPHNLYWNKDDSKVLLDGYQISGDSKSGIKSFKQFDCKFIKACIILDEKFTIQKGYNATSDRYSKSILGVIE